MAKPHLAVEIETNLSFSTKLGLVYCNASSIFSQFLILHRGRAPPKNMVTLLMDDPSVSSLGLVHSTPFASLAMTSVHAKRARSNYSKARTVSDHTNNPNEVIITYLVHII